MKRISVKKWYWAILFLLLFSLLAGCQQSDAGSHTGSVQITPTDQIRVESMTLLEQVEYDLVPDVEHASVELYTSALIADDGQMGWDSGDQWTLLVRQEEQVFLLYDEYVQYGEVQFWISSLNTNGIESPETEDLDHHIYVMVTTSVGFTMYDYGWNGDESCFQKSVLLNPETQWNTVHSNKYNLFGAHTFDKETPSEVTPDFVVEEEQTYHFAAEVVKYGNDALYVKVTDAGDSILSIGDELYVGVANSYDDYPLGCTVEVVYNSEAIVDDYGIGHTTSVSKVQ